MVHAVKVKYVKYNEFKKQLEYSWVCGSCGKYDNPHVYREKVDIKFSPCLGCSTENRIKCK